MTTKTFFLNGYRSENGECWLDQQIEVVDATRTNYPTPGFLNYGFRYTKKDGTIGDCWNSNNLMWYPEDANGEKIDVGFQPTQTTEALQSNYFG